MSEPRTPSHDAVERHPHLADERTDGHVRVDMHVHSMFSGDSTTTLEELAEQIDAAALDVVCLTDHHAIEGAARLADVASCRVIVGEEVASHSGEIIGLFLSERVPQGLSATETATRIRDQGGVVYIPHPFDPMRNCLRPDDIERLVGAGLVDGIEGRNAKTSLESLNRRATEYGEAHDLFVGAGSDAHVPDAIGAAYLEMPDFDGPDRFVAHAKLGRLVGHHFDEPRPWTPRIIPSVADGGPQDD